MLSIGQSLALELDTGNGKEKFKCKLVGLYPNQIAIDYPINTKTGKVGFFLEGQQFSASFIGTDDSVYKFTTEVQGRKKDKIPMLLLSFPGEEALLRVQRRRFVRVETAVDIAVHSTDGEFEPFTTVTADISGGGAALVIPANRTLKPEQPITCWISLPYHSGEFHYLKLQARVIRIVKNSQARDRAPIQFLHINETERDHIIRFCFDTQLNLRKKEWNRN